MHRLSICAIAAVCLGSPAALYAQDTSTTAGTGSEADLACVHKGTNGMVTALLCPEDLNEEQMRNEGIAACGARLPCGAWIWTSPEAIPTEIPEKHDALPQQSIQAATAIWVSETQSLITLGKQNK